MKHSCDLDQCGNIRALTTLYWPKIKYHASNSFMRVSNAIHVHIDYPRFRYVAIFLNRIRLDFITKKMHSMMLILILNLL